MCFNGWMSLGFAAMGLYATYWIKNTTNNNELAAGMCHFDEILRLKLWNEIYQVIINNSLFPFY